MAKQPETSVPDRQLTETQAHHDEAKRGKLRVFLGYAAGVGKTYAMLEAAQQRLAEGVDIVIGYVETHQQLQTTSLLNGLAIIPRREVSQHGLHLNEMDTDAVLSRRPQIVLVDELAHRNIPDSRHPKRYQDVEDLLDASIDVYATVNVQHIESLNDVVAQITGIRMQETIPDRLIDDAAQIELIDILPEELLRRLDEGKVCVPEQPDHSSRKFFRLGNLNALRELAMRQTARRVDHQMRSYMQTQAIPGPWAASERLLVCISSSPLSARLVRTGCRLSQELDAEWYVVYVEVPSHMSMEDTDRLQLNETMKLAESLGARVDTVTGATVPDALVDYARHINITKIIIGQPLRPRWQELLRGSIVNALIRQSETIDVYVISSSSRAAPGKAKSIRQLRRNLFAHLQAVIVVLATTLAGAVVNTVVSLNPANLVMFYLLAVVIVALRLGYGPSVVAAIASVVAFNFFFVPPQYTFHVAEAQYLLTFLGLFIVGMVIASLTSRTRSQTEAARRREQETGQLYSLSRELSATVEQDVIVNRIVNHAQQTFQCESALYLPISGTLQNIAHSKGFRAEQDELATANWAHEHGQSAGRGTKTTPSAAGHYVPLTSAQRIIGVLALYVEHDLSLQQQRLLDAFATQSALAIEAVQLGEEAQQAQLLREKEKLQTAVLNSISHDLRTPLVSITGTLSSLLDHDAHLDEHSQSELLVGAYAEAERLNRLVGNLLDMSRLEAGSMKLKRELYDLSEVIGVARSQLREQLGKRQIMINLPDDLPMIPVDLTLFAQVFVNLLDNAVKYSQPETPIEIRACRSNQCVQITIADHGIGIPADDLPHIFEKFYRASTADGQGGSGLGLSICQGIVEAHGGSIEVQNRQGGGACFQINLPLQPENSNQ
jgi:two-component system sensor histidine kinase KdpD